MMTEAFLQAIWKYKLVGKTVFSGTKQESIEIISFGEHNQDSGPDFFNSKVNIDGILLAGNIELHLKTSDWLKHQHQTNKAYDNLVLHVVYEHDCALPQNEHFNVSVLELKRYLKPGFIEQYQHFQNSKQEIACGKSITSYPNSLWKFWMEKLTVARMEVKAEYIEHLFQFTQHDFEETLYVLLCRNFGFKINSESFELLGKRLPLSVLKKYANNLLQVESLLFGVAGLLEGQFEDAYPQLLQNEFEFLKQKHRLVSLQPEIWKFSKTRPVNFPTIRLSQFAELICRTSSLFHLIETKASIYDLHVHFNVKTTNYWQTHYKFDLLSEHSEKLLGNTAFQNIMINTVAPYLIFLSKHSGKETFAEYALELLSALKPEENSKTRYYSHFGLKNENALDSQGQIHLFDYLCSKKQCFQCSVGQFLLKQV